MFRWSAFREYHYLLPAPKSFLEITIKVNLFTHTVSHLKEMDKRGCTMEGELGWMAKPRPAPRDSLKISVHAFADSSKVALAEFIAVHRPLCMDVPRS